MMNMKYINKIKGNISIYSSKKTANILDGLYKSIYKGRSMDFDDLREYTLGDDIKDIDWKSSVRSGELLIRRYIAEKKHNILFVIDSGKKMLADTKEHELKQQVALMSAGTLAYIANNHGDLVSFVYGKNNSICHVPFKSGLNNIERTLNDYEINMDNNETISIKDTLEYVKNHIRRKMIIFVITDICGIDSIEDRILKELSVSNDIMFINIGDAYMIGDNTFDIENELYIPKFIFKDNKLNELEKKIRKEAYLKCMEKLKKYDISSVTINSNSEIVKEIINLLERKKNASIR